LGHWNMREKLNSYLILFCLSALLTLPWLGRTQFYTRGEPREALVMQNIFQTGNWILPEGYGGMVPSKPPLLHWLAALVAWPQGALTEFDARFPSALAAIIFLLAFFSFLKRRVSTYEALATCLMLLTSFEWFRSVFSCRVDMLFSALSCGSLLALFNWYERDLRGFSWWAAFLLAGAALAKGPAGLVLPLGTMAFFLLLRGEGVWRLVWKLALVAVVPVCVSGAWYVLAYLERPEAFLGKVYYENVARFLGTQEDEPHAHSAPFLYATVFLGFLPWSLALLPALITWLKSLRPSRPSSFSVKQFMRQTPALELFSWVCVFCYLLFFSIPTGKRGVYLLPVYPFFAWWLVRLWAKGMIVAPRWERGAVRIMAALIILLYFIVAIVAAGQVHPESLTHSTRALTDLTYYFGAIGRIPIFTSIWSLALLAIPLSLAITTFFGARKVKSAASWFWIAFVMFFSVILAVQASIFPRLMNGLSAKTFAQEIKATVAGRTDLYSFNNEFYGLSFYLNQKISRYEDLKPQSGYLLVNLHDMPEFLRVYKPSRSVEFMHVSANGIVRPSDKAALVRFE
jgi:4-amino-4-deoxy-L-arabinose transferase-like glycosyltransferase